MKNESEIDIEVLIKKTEALFHQIINDNPEVLLELNPLFNIENYSKYIELEFHSMGLIKKHQFYSGELEFVKFSILLKEEKTNVGYILEYFRNGEHFEDVLHFD